VLIGGPVVLSIRGEEPQAGVGDVARVGRHAEDAASDPSVRAHVLEVLAVDHDVDRRGGPRRRDGDLVQRARIRELFAVAPSDDPVGTLQGTEDSRDVGAVVLFEGEADDHEPVVTVLDGRGDTCGLPWRERGGELVGRGEANDVTASQDRSSLAVGEDAHEHDGLGLPAQQTVMTARELQSVDSDRERGRSTEHHASPSLPPEAAADQRKL
jgi:hypothetical protein